MAWTTPKTWTDTTDRLNSANLNQYIRDNQIALRGDAAALMQRVGALEGAGYSDAVEAAVTLNAGTWVFTTLAPVINARFFDFSVRIGNSRWSPIFRADISDWLALPTVQAGDTFSAANGLQYQISMNVGRISQIRVGRSTDQQLAFAAGGSRLDDAYDRVSVRWFV